MDDFSKLFVDRSSPASLSNVGNADRKISRGTMIKRNA